jgi:hypothetical protein
VGRARVARLVLQEQEKKKMKQVSKGVGPESNLVLKKYKCFLEFLAAVFFNLNQRFKYKSNIFSNSNKFKPSSKNKNWRLLNQNDLET